MVHIPYRGTSQAMTDVLTGRVDMMFAPIVVALPHLQSGALHGLSITSLDRSRLLPEVPTVREAGLPEAEKEDRPVRADAHARCGDRHAI
jgi:tripartite-type tricarboxylate transporter receptor subunit TctC